MLRNESAEPASATIDQAVVDSPLGPLRLSAGPQGVRSIVWLDADEERGARPGEGPGPVQPVLSVLSVQLDEYFRGVRRDFDVPLDPQGTDFQLRAWRFLRGIPFGETRSYGQQAEALGGIRFARAVGGANGRNPLSIVVPCHRVVGADGRLTGFSSGIERKQWLLDHERAAQLAASTSGA